MTFEQFLTIIVRRWWLVLLCFLAGGAGAYGGSKLVTPLYQSGALVQVAVRLGNNPADYNSLLASDQLVQTEAQLATSDPVLREVATHFRGLTPDLLAKKVSASVKVNTQIFEIDVLDTNPQRASALANDIAAVLIEQQKLALQQDTDQSQQQLQQELNATQKQIDVITSQIATLQANNGDPARIAVLQAQLNALQQHESQWQSVAAQLKLTEAQSNGFLRVVQPAQPGQDPVQPNRILYVGAGLLIGLLLGILLALLLEKSDTRVRTSEALAQILSLPVLATIWKRAARDPVINPDGHSRDAEAYRLLRTALGFSAVDKPLYTLMITSALPREGKSVIAANLAIFMAKAGKNTLLIDADLRRPEQHHLFELAKGKKGLSDAILATGRAPTGTTSPFLPALAATQPLSQSRVPVPEVSLELFTHRVGIPGLWVMPSGPLPPNPPELLDSKAMRNLLTAINDSGFEVVVLDTAPLLGLSDAGILASKVDGTLIVVDISRANRGILKQMKAQLVQLGIHAIGSVVNKQRRHNKDAVYYSYHYQEDEQDSEEPAVVSAAPVASASDVHGQNGHRYEGSEEEVPTIVLRPPAAVKSAVDKQGRERDEDLEDVEVATVLRIPAAGVRAKKAAALDSSGDEEDVAGESRNDKETPEGEEQAGSAEP